MTSSWHTSSHRHGGEGLVRHLGVGQKKNQCHWSGSSGHVTDFEEVRKYKSGVTANSGDMRVVSSVWKPSTMSMTSLWRHYDVTMTSLWPAKTEGSAGKVNSWEKQPRIVRLNTWCKFSSWRSLSNELPLKRKAFKSSFKFNLANFFLWTFFLVVDGLKALIASKSWVLSV